MAQAKAGQYLTFRLGEETYGIEVEKVLEVQEQLKITRVPRSPHYMLGVVNLRGSVVPVVDMRVKLGLPRTAETIDTCVVVMEISEEEDQWVLGGLVDAVQEVVTLTNDLIEPPPRVGLDVNTDLISGMGKKGDRFVILLDVNRAFSAAELSGGGTS